MNVQDVVDRVFQEGPTKVICKSDGSVLPGMDAIKQGLFPDIILIRCDGWTLGAPANLSGPALLMFPGQWTHYVLRPDRYAQPIDTLVRVINERAMMAGTGNMTVH